MYSVRFLMAACICALAASLYADDKQSSQPPKTTAPAGRPELRTELLQRVVKDQKVRLELIQWMQKQPAGSFDDLARANDPRLETMRKIDEENTAWLKEQVEKTGWLGKSLVGQDGAHSAWLLLQHADQDPAFQKKCLKLMQAAPAGEVAATDIAYLTDRIMLKESNQQLYGTQVESKNGKWIPRKLKDPEHVDMLRKEMGLPPMAEYLKVVEQMYSGKKPTHGDKK